MNELYQIWNDLRCSCETFLSFKDWMYQHQDQSNIVQSCEADENEQEFTEDDFIVDELELIY
jgi:hypothetical protein